MMTKNLAQIWAEMLAALSASFEGRSWKIWLDAAHPRTLEENTLSLDVPNDFTKNTLQEKYLPIMEESLSQICGKPMKVQIDVVETAKEGPSLFPDAPAQPAPEPAAVHPEPQPTAKPAQEFDSHLSPKYTFDNFIRGKSNEEAFNFSMGVANAPAKSYNPLFLYSDPGLGKTHLMNAIGNYIHKKFPQMKILYTSSETFTNELIGAIQHNTNEAFRNKYRNIDVLLIDDIQFLSGKDATLEQFFHTFNTLHQANKRIVIASDVPPKDLQGFNERLISRFESGLTVDVKPPDLETRIAILRMIATMNGSNIPNDVFNLIAERFTENIRELEGALNRVTAMASLSNQPVTKALAEQTLQDFFTTDVEIKPADIITQVAKYFYLTFDDIVGRSRTKKIALARQIAMYLVRELTSMSLNDIGLVFGGKDHTTVMHAYTRINDEMQEKQEIYNYVTELTLQLKQRSNDK